MPRKPTATEIARAGRLTLQRDNPRLPADRITACNVCGRPSSSLMLYRECGQNDQPIAGAGARLYVDAFDDEHRACRKAIDDHARLYMEETGDPGGFPELCGPCLHRAGDGCKSPHLRANGGEGLLVTLDGLTAIVCRRGSCSSPVKHAVKCAGREVAP